MSTFDLDRALRWFSRRPLPRESDLDIVYLDERMSFEGPILLDTCVYIDQLRGKAPLVLGRVLTRGLANHSTVALQELLHTLGVLDPRHPRSHIVARDVAVWAREIAGHRLLVPDPDTLGRAALLAGLLCRLRGYARDDRMRALHDCVLFLQARKSGYAVLTANVRDFALLAQMEPHGRVLFYRVA